MAERMRIHRHTRAGTLKGELLASEDEDELCRALVEAKENALSGTFPLLVHTTSQASEQAQQERENKRRALLAGKLGRYVFKHSTRQGERVVKIAEVVTLGNQLAGILSTSVAKREHLLQQRTELLNLATTHSCGYLELRRGPYLVRSCQVQTLIPPHLLTLDDVLPGELKRYGDDALEPLAVAIAAMHQRGFFHADLKGFHAHVQNLTPQPMGPSHYHLTWIDLARVAFHITRRRRLINLYQVTRFILPARPSAHARFINTYSQMIGLSSRQTTRMKDDVARFLAHKYLTHPVA